MKLIHCADLHLGAGMRTNLSGEQAILRKRELLFAVRDMVNWAKEQEVEGILIAGDLFDDKAFCRETHVILDGLMSLKNGIHFFYLKGNHDQFDVPRRMSGFSETVNFFNRQWTSYRMGKRVVISGMEFGEAYSGQGIETLQLNPDDINIVMLHGMISEYGGGSDMALRELRNKHIDYLALGHIHSYERGQLDARGVYCYSGCLEPRGFDEPGQHGFVLLDIDEETGTCTDTFIPFAKRQLHQLKVDISDTLSTTEIAERIRTAMEAAQLPTKDMLKVRLVGTVLVECEKNVELLQKLFEEEMYMLKIYDESTLKVDYSRFAADATLKGEFVRTVMADETLEEEEKAAIVRCGIGALAGEEL